MAVELKRTLAQWTSRRFEMRRIPWWRLAIALCYYREEFCRPSKGGKARL